MTMLRTLHDKNVVSIYCKNLFHSFIPYFRRFLRFLALPYCYFFLVNWHECKQSRFQVIKDLLYIFFRLKYFPDNYSCCRLWEKHRNEWSYYYGSTYDPYQKAKLSKEVQRIEYQIIFEDKEVCQQLCEGMQLPVPKCLGIIDPHDDYRLKIKQIFRKFGLEKIIIKPVRGAAGRGIVLAFNNGGEGILKSGKTEVTLDKYILEERAIIQEVVIQNDLISTISPASINTIRIITLYTRSQEVIILKASITFGVGDSFVNNWSAGGISVGVDTATGKLFKAGYDKFAFIYTAHPTSHVIFEDFQIPQWHEILQLAITAQVQFPYYKLLGMDIALTKTSPLLIEINAFPDMVAEEQESGPLLQDDRIRFEFQQYDLFINNFQKSLK